MTRPVRLQLSHRKGFHLQTWSRQVNGLEAENCARPGKWGNQFVVSRHKSAAECVESFRLSIASNIWTFPTKHDIRHGLAGKNLACFCHLCPKHAATGKPLDEHCPDCAPCHVDVLGEIVCETVG